MAGTGDDEPALEAALNAGLVDMVLMDLNLRGAGGFRVIERLRKRPRPPAVLVLSSEATRHSVSTALRLGVAGYLQKTSPLEEFGPALESIRQGRVYFGAGDARRLAEELAGGSRAKARAQLTERETHLLISLAQGLTAQEIALRLQLSRHTVYKQREKVLKKIGARTRREVEAYVTRIGLRETAPGT